MILAQEKVVVVELNGVDSVLALQVRQNCRRTLRGLDLFSIEHRNHSTEVALVGTADAGLVDCRTRPEERGQDILRWIEAMIGEPGKIARRLHGPLGVVNVQSEAVLERKASNPFESAAGADRRQ